MSPGGLLIVDVAPGPGVDIVADGATYVFNYANSGEYIDPVDPTTLSPVLEIVDHFNLLGQGKTQNLKVFLKGRFNSTTFEPIDDPVVRGPDIFCDPI